MNKNVILSAGIACYVGFSLAFALYANASGLLRVNPQNPRYFTDDSGRAIYLGGNQIFGDLQDYGWSSSYTDWRGYLKFARNKNLNFLRNWTIWSTHGGRATPMQYVRTGPGTAADGQPKFDLTQFNQDFFDRMRSRIIDAGNNGIYVSIMLFDVYAFGNHLWADNLFNGANNIQGIDVDDDHNNWGTEFFSPSSAVAQIQKDYVKKVIDTVRDLDNVFFEVANEATAIQWQYDMINFIRLYDGSRHLVYMSAGGMNTQGTWEGMNNSDVANSPSDMFAVLDASGIPYDPPIDNTGKPVVIDTDHTNPGKNGRDLPWRAITRGYHFNLYDHPWEAPQTESADWDLVRSNIGQANRYAEHAVNLAGMNPSTSICSTAFCLVSPGVEYLIYAPDGGPFTVNLQTGKYSYEWFNPSTALVQGSGTVFADGGNQSFTPEFGGDAVLYLKSETVVPDPPPSQASDYPPAESRFPESTNQVLEWKSLGDEVM